MLLHFIDNFYDAAVEWFGRPAEAETGPGDPGGGQVQH